MRYLKGIRNKRIILFLFSLLVVIFVVDYLVEKKQEKIVHEREKRLKKLEKQAFYMLAVDIRDVKETKNIRKTGNYEVLLRVDNISNEPVYISHPEVKAYVQAGDTSWTELPVQDINPHTKEQVHRIEPEAHILYKKILTISSSIRYNKNLLPLYMHVKFYISMEVLSESEFQGGNVVERNSTTFVYIKPFWVSTSEIRKLLDFADNRVPVYIPITAFRLWK